MPDAGEQIAAGADIRGGLAEVRAELGIAGFDDGKEGLTPITPWRGPRVAGPTG